VAENTEIMELRIPVLTYFPFFSLTDPIFLKLMQLGLITENCCRPVAASMVNMDV